MGRFAGHNNSKKKKAAAILMSIMILGVLLLSVAFLIHEADHDCTGEDCPVCAMMQQCENTLSRMGTGANISVLAAFAAILSLFILYTQPASAVTAGNLRFRKTRFDE